VPDPFLVDVYKKSGVTIPIFVVPLGVHYGRSLVMPLKSVTNKPFVFSNLSVVIDRKNTLKTIQAFIQAFGDRPDVQLRLNGREFDAEYLSQCRNEIKKSGVHNVHITTRSLSRDVFNRCLYHSDCYISLSKGEGFSLIPREAMALGVPVIVTDNTGQSTIAQSGLVGVVPSRIERPALYHISDKFFAKGINYDFDIDDAVAAMRHVVDNHDDYLKRGPQCRQWAMRYAYTNPELQKKYIRLFLRPMQARIGECDDVQDDGLVFDRNNPSSIRLMHKYIRLFALNK
jgi:glycosyltransferase involved in cell wall biosynthesis